MSPCFRSRPGYAIVTGLAYNVIKKTAENLKTFDVEEKPPPPEQPPPPPKDMPKVPPPPMTPRRSSGCNAPEPPIQTVTQVPQLAPPPIAPPPRPAPPPQPRQSQARSLIGILQGLISSEDYPPSALDNNEQGSVQVSTHRGAQRPSDGLQRLRERDGDAQKRDLPIVDLARPVQPGSRCERKPRDE